MIALDINGRKHQVDVDPETPLLWVPARVGRHDRH